MNFLLRIPGWLLSILLLLTVTPFLLLVFLPFPHLGIERNTLHGVVHRNDDLIIWSLLLCLLLLNAVALALTLKHLEQDKRAALLAIPVLFSLCFLALIVPVGIESAFNPPAGILQSISEAIQDLIMKLTPEVFFFSGLGLMVVSLLLTAYCLVRLVGRNRKEWVLIPLSVIILPIGLWWLQPRWRALLDRKPVEETVEHFVE